MVKRILPKATTKSRRDPSCSSSASTIPESNDIYEIVDDQPQHATGADPRSHGEASLPAHHERNATDRLGSLEYESSNFTQPHRTPLQPTSTIHNLSELRNHKRITILQHEPPSNITRADSTMYTDHKCASNLSKRTMEALSHKELRKIYGQVSISIMEKKGCFGVALRDSSSRTPIEPVEHDGAGIGFEEGPDVAQRRRKKHKCRRWAEREFSSKSILFVPAQSTTTTTPSTIPTRCPRVTTYTRSRADKHTEKNAFEQEDARYARAATKYREDVDDSDSRWC